jgi:ATP-dependent helicase HepA
VFVKARGQRALLGIGKLISRSGQSCSVEYFEAPFVEPKIIDLEASELEAFRLPEQTRIYYFNPAFGSWEIGRVLDDVGDRQFIKFPNGVSRYLAAQDVFVRSARHIDDPTSFLAAKINETPRFADDRSKFVRSVVNQRAASMGMSALTSSAVELEAHQIEVVRRVLQDPIQRYLLADEVGLGKTIEAGVLIRQCIIDGGGIQSILVVVPDALVAQWRSELTSKFFLGHVLDKAIQVVALNDVSRIRSLLARATMLVVDEAHHLTDRRLSSYVELYSDFAVACLRIERVLLLSATPALHNERGFLDMLHLLDPENYPLGDEDGFRSRIRNRQALAEIVAGLTPQNVLFLDATLDRLAELFPQDRLLMELTKELRAVSDVMPEEDDPILVDLVGRVRSHLSESYRLHRRILRHRRRSIGGLTPGRSGVVFADYDSVESIGTFSSFEDWRLSELAGQRGPEMEAGAVLLFTQLLERISQFRIAQAMPDLTNGEAAPPADPDALRHVFRRLGNPEIFEARASALVLALKPLLGTNRQFVVFCSDQETANALAKFLSEQLEVSVDRHDPQDESWLSFNENTSRPLLVCDRRAEEGLNLQGGRKTIVHYDLPLNPNRIEQRLGRVDRYGSGDPVRSIVLRSNDNPIEACWIDYLASGLRIFDRSVASLQYLIEDSLKDLPKLLFEEGLDALIDLTKRSAGDDGIIEREIKNLDQQDALEALGAPPSELFDALSDVDEDWKSVDRDTSDWIERTLLFIRTGLDSTVPGGPREIFRYRYTTFNQHTLVPLETFYEACREAVDLSPASRVARMVRTMPLTYRRRIALGRQGRACAARVLRYGDPLIMGMWEITQADDRGRSTALWRYMPDYSADDLADLFFRIDFVVTADLSGPLEILGKEGRLTHSAAASMSRRGDMALQPFFQTIWLDGELTLVEDAATLARLTLRYRPDPDDMSARDFNLNPKRWQQMTKLELPQLESWPESCANARLRAEASLRNLPKFNDSLEKAVVRALATDHGRLGQLRARADRNMSATAGAEWSLEKSLSESLIEGVRQPLVHVDAMLACFVSGDRAATAALEGRA